MTIIAAEAAEAGGEAAAEDTLSSQAGEYARDRAKRAARSYAGQAQQVGRTAQITPGRRTYQGAILAEFVAAVFIVAITPIATGGSPDAQAKGSGSPYSVNNLRQLVAIGVTYFVLALIPGEQGSRIAAWLGGLVLLVLLMIRVSNGDLTAAAQILAPAPKDAGGGTQVA